MQTSGWCQENNCTAPFPDAQELHSRSTLKANVCISQRKFLFQRRSKILSAFVFYLLNKVLKAACCLGLAKCFTIHILQFWKFNYISAF